MTVRNIFLLGLLSSFCLDKVNRERPRVRFKAVCILDCPLYEGKLRSTFALWQTTELPSNLLESDTKGFLLVFKDCLRRQVTTFTS